jgi:hypothetical protein
MLVLFRVSAVVPCSVVFLHMFIYPAVPYSINYGGYVYALLREQKLA